MKAFLALWLAVALPILTASETPAKLQFKVAARAGEGGSRERAVKRLHEGRSHILLEFDQPPTPDRVREVSAGGLEVIAPVPDVGVLAVVSPGAKVDLAGVVRAAALDPASKFSPLLRPLFTRREAVQFLIEFHPDTRPGEERAIALREGLAIHDHPDVEPAHLLVEGTREMAAAITAWDEVAYVFPASGAMKNSQPVLPCAAAMLSQGWVPQYLARIGPGWDGPGLSTAILTYSYEALSERLSPEQSKSEIERALREWSQVVQVQFHPAADARASRNLNFLFARRDYGGVFPFDGAGGKLAQAFYPPPPSQEPIAGDIHFDDDEDWNVGVRYDLFSVALHELGHALGLGHSDDPEDVMYPYYRQAETLSSGDIAAIRQMYAPRRPFRGTSRSAGPSSGR